MKLLLIVLFGISPFYSGDEQPTTNQPTEMEQAIDVVSKADELVLQFKEKQAEGWVETTLNGDYLTKAEVKTDEFSQNFVSLTFNNKGADLLAEITEKTLVKNWEFLSTEN